MTGNHSPTRRLAEMTLGSDLEEFVRSRRADKRPWRFIARDLYEATDGEVDLTYETLRSWFPDKPTAGTEVAS